MTFLHPILAALGIAAVSIPIIIHLLMRRRRKPVMWAAMRFLLQAYKEHRRRLRLEQFLLLAARCLLIALIGLGVARPMLGAGSVLGGRASMTLYLLVDNSLTASARDETGRTALARHQAQAAKLLDQLDPGAGDRAGLIALGSPALASVVPASADPAAVKAVVAQLTTTDSAADASGAMAILDAALAGRGDAAAGGATGRTVVVVLSDFLHGSADTERKLATLSGSGGAGVTLLAPTPAERGVDNTSIIAVEPLRPVLIGSPTPDAAATRTRVTVRLRRSGPGVASPASVNVRLRVAAPDDRPGPPAGQGTVRFEPGQSEASASIEIGPPPGVSGTLVLSATIDDDAVAGDNDYRRPLEVRSSLRVGVVSPRRAASGVVRPAITDFEPGEWLRLALDPYTGDRPGAARPARDTDVIEVDPVSVDAARLSGLDAVFLPRPDLLPESSWRHVRALADSGGLVVVSPPPGVTVHLWADAFLREMGLDWTIAREATVFAEAASIAHDSTDRSGAGGPGSLLSLIEQELRDLAGPVRVTRVLKVDAPPERSTEAAVAMLPLTDGTPLIVASPPGTRLETTAPAPADDGSARRGLVVFVATAWSFDWTDLPARPLMVPLVHELVVQGVARSRGDWTAIAGARPELPSRTAELRPIGGGRDGEAPIAAGRDGIAAEPVRRAGLWRAVDDRAATRGLIVVNPDAAAGRTDAQAASNVQGWLAAAVPGGRVEWLEAGATPEADAGEGLRARLEKGPDGAPFAFILLLSALGLALLELGLARWFSHARTGDGREPGAEGGA